MTEKHWETAKLNVTLIFCSVCLHVCIVCIYQHNTTTVEAGAQMLAWLLCCLVQCLARRTNPVSGAQEHTRCPYTTWLWCWKLWPTCQWKHQSRVITEQRKTSQQGNSHQSKTQQRTSLAGSVWLGGTDEDDGQLCVPAAVTMFPSENLKNRKATIQYNSDLLDENKTSWSSDPRPLFLSRVIPFLFLLQINIETTFKHLP